MKDLLAPLKELALNRYPIRVDLAANDIPLPHILIHITNRTSNMPVEIRAVRVHFGSDQFNRSLTLIPFGAVELAPKKKKTWRLSYEPDETLVSVNYITPKPPSGEKDPDGPGIDSPAQIFNAIGRGNPKDSWIELDFNEYEKRKFKKGKIKNMFDNVGNSMNARREREAEENA